MSVWSLRSIILRRLRQVVQGSGLNRTQAKEVSTRFSGFSLPTFCSRSAFARRRKWPVVVGRGGRNRILISFVGGVRFGRLHIGFGTRLVALVALAQCDLFASVRQKKSERFRTSSSRTSSSPASLASPPLDMDALRSMPAKLCSMPLCLISFSSATSSGSAVAS